MLPIAQSKRAILSVLFCQLKHKTSGMRIREIFTGSGRRPFLRTNRYAFANDMTGHISNPLLM